MDEFDKTIKELDFTDETKEVVEEIAELDKKKKGDSIYTSFLETEDYILEEVSSSPLSPDSPLVSGRQS